MKVKTKKRTPKVDWDARFSVMFENKSGIDKSSGRTAEPVSQFLKQPAVHAKTE